MINLNDYLETIQDFPEKGVLFYDITPMMMSPVAFNFAIDKMIEEIAQTNPTKIVAADARGFFFGPTIAMRMNLPFVPIRKKGKLPRETISASYELEYGSNTLYAHKDDISANDSIAIIDDILATGGTAEAICKIVESQGAKVACLAFYIELDFLKGKEKLNNRKVISILNK